MSETLKFEGRLAMLKKEAAKLELLIKAGIESLRGLLDPFEDLEYLRTDEAAAQAVDLAGVVTQWREMKAQIRAIEKELGR